MHPETELLNKLIDQSTGCYTVCISKQITRMWLKESVRVALGLS